MATKQTEEAHTCFNLTIAKWRLFLPPQDLNSSYFFNRLCLFLYILPYNWYTLRNQNLLDMFFQTEYNLGVKKDPTLQLTQVILLCYSKVKEVFLRRSGFNSQIQFDRLSMDSSITQSKWCLYFVKVGISRIQRLKVYIKKGHTPQMRTAILLLFDHAYCLQITIRPDCVTVYGKV